jgi:hypothetical protein
MPTDPNVRDELEPLSKLNATPESVLLEARGICARCLGAGYLGLMLDERCRRCGGSGNAKEPARPDGGPSVG